jgi:hypothetical protein
LEIHSAPVPPWFCLAPSCTFLSCLFQFPSFCLFVLVFKRVPQLYFLLLVHVNCAC